MPCEALLCPIALKLSNTHKFMLNTYMSFCAKTVCNVCEGKQQEISVKRYFKSAIECIDTIFKLFFDIYMEGK